MPFSSVSCQNCNSTIQCCKNLTHLTHLIKLRFWCLVCQMPNIIAFDTFRSSAVDAHCGVVQFSFQKFNTQTLFNSVWYMESSAVVVLQRALLLHLKDVRLPMPLMLIGVLHFYSHGRSCIEFKSLFCFH